MGPRFIRRGLMCVPISPECVLTRTIPNATNQIVPHGALGRTTGGEVIKSF